MTSVAERTVKVNGAFHGQRVTGQQRYAHEITRRLLERRSVDLVRPSSRVSASTAASWLWSLVGLPLSARRSVLLSLTSRAPVWHPRHVVVVHDLFVLTNPEWYSMTYVASHAPLLRATLRTAKHVVAVSEPVAEQVRRSGLTKAPVTVAPNAPSPVFARPVGAHDLPDDDLPDGRFLLVVGSMDPRKNLPGLVRAYATLPAVVRQDHPLVIVGGTNAIFRASEIDPVDGVIMTGYVSDEALSGLYARARAVVFPSFAEGFGLPLVEAAIAGARVAASDIPVFRWIAGDHPEYFDPSSHDSLTGVLRSLIEDARPVDPSFARTVSERFSWDASAAAVFEACRGVPGSER